MSSNLINGDTRAFVLKPIHTGPFSCWLFWRGESSVDFISRVLTSTGTLPQHFWAICVQLIEKRNPYPSLEFELAPGMLFWPLNINLKRVVYILFILYSILQRNVFYFLPNDDQNDDNKRKQPIVLWYMFDCSKLRTPRSPSWQQCYWFTAEALLALASATTLTGYITLKRHFRVCQL